MPVCVLQCFSLLFINISWFSLYFCVLCIISVYFLLIYGLYYYLHAVIKIIWISCSVTIVKECRHSLSPFSEVINDNNDITVSPG
jgi:hypothetical protein